jgi:hypothetical protein
MSTSLSGSPNAAPRPAHAALNAGPASIGAKRPCELRSNLDVVHHVALCHEQVFPTVIVDVHESCTPARVLHCGAPNSRRIGHVSQRSPGIPASSSAPAPICKRHKRRISSPSAGTSFACAPVNAPEVGAVLRIGRPLGTCGDYDSPRRMVRECHANRPIAGFDCQLVTVL